MKALAALALGIFTGLESAPAQIVGAPARGSASRVAVSANGPASNCPSPLPGQAGARATRAARPWLGGWWGFPYSSGSRDAAAPVEGKTEGKEDKLKELIISPVYEPARVNPKMIELP
jgi:hypothetical protein